MKVTRKQVSIVALSMAAFVVLAGVLLYFQFREPRYEGKTFSEWARLLNSRTLFYDQHAEAVDAIVAMGPRAIPWVQDAVRMRGGSSLTLLDQMRFRLPAWIGVHLPKRTGYSISPADACVLLGALEPDGATTIPLLIQCQTNTSTLLSGIYLRGMRRFHPPPEKIVPLVLDILRGTNWMKKGTAVRLLRDYPAEVVKLLPDLEQRLTSRDDWFNAVKLVTDCGPEASNALPKLQSMLTESSTMFIRPFAAQAIAKVSPARATAMASAMTNHFVSTDSTDQKIHALDVIAGLGPDALPALPMLIHLLQTGPPEISSQAAAAIGAIGPEARSATGALKEASERNRSVIESIALGLRDLFPGGAAFHERVHALIALARVDPTFSDECGTRLISAVRSLSETDHINFVCMQIDRGHDPGWLIALFGLLEGKGDDLISPIARYVWQFDYTEGQRLIPILKRVIERNSKGNPLRTKAIKALRLIAPLEAGRYQ